MSFLAWIRRRRMERKARRVLADAFRTPSILLGTSLKPHHGARAVVTRHDEEEGRIVRVFFGIVRHPRPYAFSPQSHRVLVYYSLDVEAGRIDTIEGHNITRAEGRDADD